MVPNTNDSKPQKTKKSIAYLSGEWAPPFGNDTIYGWVTYGFLLCEEGKDIGQEWFASGFRVESQR